MDTLRFEWDPNKNEINKKKHGLSFEAAKEVFYDEFAILFDDPDHSIEEDARRCAPGNSGHLGCPITVYPFAQ